VAYEIDRDLAAELRSTAAENVHVIEGDFLEAFGTTTEPPNPLVVSSSNHERGDSSSFDWLRTSGERLPRTLRVAGNLPYNVASPILFKLVDIADRRESGPVPLSDATLMVQREVADRLVANPGTRDYGVLTVLIRHRASIQRLLNLPPGAFRPPPKVHSSLVRLRFHAPDPPVRDRHVFNRVVQAVFTRRRKTMANALLAYQGTGAQSADPQNVLLAAGIDGRRRPETLTIAEFARLAETLSNA
jgi:16S rRNA (adenine1518-N6/adenine1519-N6)-dimethyltransferase